MVTCIANDGNAYTLTPSGTYPPLGPAVFAGGLYKFTSTTFVQYNVGTGTPAQSVYPTAGLVQNWGNGGACGGVFTTGGVDYGTGGATITMRITVAGPGTLTIHTEPHPGGMSGSCGTSGTISANAYVSGGLGGLVDSDAQAAGTDLTLVIPDDGFCVHHVDIIGSSGPWGYAGADWLETDTSVHADFTHDLTAARTAAFTDTSHGGTGTIDTWAWDFGDGGTATTQNPTHVYAAPGTYEVTLTVETDDAETATVTRSVFVPSDTDYEPPEPGGAIVEIYASAVGAARWGVAHWGEDVWATAGWVNVTPQSIDAQIRWGSHSPERGILAETEAASWIVDTYDPERLLDPGNPDGPYATDLRAGLPIRIRHRGTIIRQGVAETIAYFHQGSRGGIRVTDAISELARSSVPDDSILADTLRARARDAIAAAGVSVTVESDPPGGDPALAPRLEGDRSVWRHIADAAEQTLHIAYVDRLGVVRFRPWSAPYDRGRGVDETQLVNLGTVVATRGLYSVVQAQQTVADGDALIERRLTPTPRYGAVVYKRSDPTPDADAWAAAVLADRSLQTVQWIPGAIFPLDANAVEYFATLEAMERFGVDDAAADPPVDVTGIIVGGSILVTSKREAEAVWSFELELAQTADSPLYTDTDPAEFLLNETGDGYLYGD